MGVLVKQKFSSEGYVLSMKNLALQELGIKKVPEKGGATIRAKMIEDFPKTFLDVRCFGAALTVGEANASIVGPVQFNIARSLNKPNFVTYPLSASISSGEEKGAGTLGEFHVVDYSFILFHGIACEHSAKVTGMTEEDLVEVYRGMWWGTKVLNTRSKFGHVPRFIISAVSAKEKFQIGDIWRHVKMDKQAGLKSIDDVKVNITGLLARLKENKSNLESVETISDGQTTFTVGDVESKDLSALLSQTGIPVKTLKL
jgi:CRISPR-associated protein Csh2